MRRVVITGIGVVAPAGIGRDAFWRGLLEGKSRIELEPEMERIGTKSRVVSRVHDFRLEDHFDAVERTRMAGVDRVVQFGVASGQLAIADAKLPALSDAENRGIIFSSAIGGTPSIQGIWESLTDGGKGPFVYRPSGEHFYNAGMFNYSAVLLARKFGFAGPCTALSTGCTAGLDALGLARQTIATGEADVMLAGATEAPLTSLTYATLDVIGSLSVADAAPEKASRPFDAKRAGFVIGEGAAVLVLESEEHARARGAHIYAEAAGYTSDSNAFHMTDLPEHGEPMSKVIANCVRSAGIQNSEIDYINAHGSSTPQNDVFETNAYKAIFGERARRIPISSTKSIIGHSLSSASLMGVIAALGAIELKRVHPTINYEFPDPACDLDYVVEGARAVDVRTALVTASGFGGIHSAAIFRRMGRQ